MRGFSIVLTALIMCAALASGQAQSGSTTGIEGVITIGPTQPGPARIDASSSQPLPNATFVVENQTGEVASFTTNDQGHFQVTLPPGHYKVSFRRKGPGIGRFGPFEADVVAGQITNVQWHCDSGIR